MTWLLLVLALNPVMIVERLDGDVEDWCGAELVLRASPGQPHVLAPTVCPLFRDGFES